MLLSDMGAHVLRLDRPGTAYGDPTQIVGRGRTAVSADLKNAADLAQVMALVAHADVLVEGFRPGVMERLGLGPEDMLQRNPRLVYGRMTGWGQTGPLAQSAGHDINYIAITGALDAIGPRAGKPVPPLNLVGDYGGGSLYLVAGILAALHERSRSGQGQVVDAAIIDGVASMMSTSQAQALRGAFREQRGTNLLDGGSPYYDTYRTADGRFVSIGAIEPQFFQVLCEQIGIPEALRTRQNDVSAWPALRAAFEQAFAAHPLSHWSRQLEGRDACFAPVLTLSEAALHPQMVARGVFRDFRGTLQPAPSPRFSRTPSDFQGPPPAHAIAVQEALAQWDVAELHAAH
jgi:alpha-methylacyl-CoA racemase